MKKLSNRILCLLLAIFLLLEPSNTSAKTKPPKLNRTKVSITAGSKVQLKLSGTKKKVKWTVKNSKIASVSKKEQEDGDDVYYLEETNDFVIVSTDGYIRTYFKPENGIDYFNRQ